MYTVKSLPLTPAFQIAQFSPIRKQLLKVASYKSYQSFFIHIQVNKSILVPFLYTKVSHDLAINRCSINTCFKRQEERINQWK